MPGTVVGDGELRAVPALHEGQHDARSRACRTALSRRLATAPLELVPVARRPGPADTVPATTRGSRMRATPPRATTSSRSTGPVPHRSRRAGVAPRPAGAGRRPGAAGRPSRPARSTPSPPGRPTPDGRRRPRARCASGPAGCAVRARRPRRTGAAARPTGAAATSIAFIVRASRAISSAAAGSGTRSVEAGCAVIRSTRARMSSTGRSARPTAHQTSTARRRRLSGIGRSAGRAERCRALVDVLQRAGDQHRPVSRRSGPAAAPARVGQVDGRDPVVRRAAVGSGSRRPAAGRHHRLPSGPTTSTTTSSVGRSLGRTVPPRRHRRRDRVGPRGRGSRPGPR